MKYISKTLLDELYEQTELQLIKAISEWQQLPAEFMTAQPGPGKWSAAQCLEHLNSYGRYYLPAIEKAMSSGKAAASQMEFKSGVLGNYFYKIMLPDTGGQPVKRMRSPKDHRPAEQLNSVAVLSEFIGQLEKLQHLLTMAQRKDLNKIKVPISIARFIHLKLGDVFLFYTAHVHRHLLQAERAMTAAGYRPSPSVTVKENKTRIEA